MSEPAQKFSSTALPPDLLARPQLISTLMEGLQKNAHLFLVIAPAGYGKSTLIANWIQTNHIPNIWLNLDLGDNDLPTLVDSIHQAIDLFQASQHDAEPVGSTITFDAAAPKKALNSIIERFDQIKKTVLLVFDRQDQIQNSEPRDFIARLSSQLPMKTACVIISRHDPSLAISRMRAHNQLVELDESDLRFSQKETRQFLEGASKENIDTRNLKILDGKIRGWAVGLRLSIDLLGSQLSTPNSLAVSGFNGSHHYISDYFSEEVFSKVSPTLQTFLIRCSVFNQFSAPLCRSVLDMPNAGEIIQELIDHRLFVNLVEGNQDWFEFHPLFKDYLISKCEPGEKRGLYRRTALWFRERGELDLAVEYGLQSGDEQTALMVIEPACEKAILDGNIQTVSNWLKKWTLNGFQKRAELLVYNGWINALQGDFMQAQILKEQAQELLKVQGKSKDKDKQQNDQITQGKMASLQAFIEVMYSQQYANASKEAKQALKLLPKNRSAWNLMALWAQAETQKRIDHIGKSVETLYEALRMGRSIGGKVFYYAAANSLAAALHFHGRRSEAFELCQKTITNSADPNDPALGGIYAWIGRLFMEANQLEQAQENIQIGVQLNEQPKANLNLIFAYYYASQIYQAAGRGEQALDSIQRAKRLAGNASLSDECWLNAWEANLNMLQGNHIQVEHWLRMEGPKLDQKPDYLNMEMLLVHARYLVQKGDLNNAARRLQNLEKFSSRRGYYRWLLTIYLLQSIVWEKKDKHAQALECIKRALHIAAPEEYQRAFLNEDPLVLKLVQEISAESPAFVMRLLRSASSLGKGNKKIPASILPDPLSEREMQVLKLLASGKKGPQIADELFIAYSTVRTHLKSIHRKLEVHTRQELLEKIRLLELI